MSDYHADYSYDFDPAAQNNTAATIYRMALEGGKTILDLGSGPAIVTSHLKQTHGRQVTCVDNDEERLTQARGRGVDRTILSDLDGPGWAEQLRGEVFDVIILADVLEHLTHPEEVLRRIRDEGLLAPSGFLVVSIPNASHVAVVAELLTDRFRYRETGLLDSTHLRFFTRETFIALAEETGFVVSALERTTRTLEQTEFAPLAAELPPAVREYLRDAPETRTYQFIARLEPVADAGEMGVLRHRLEATQVKLAEATRRLDTLRATHEQVVHNLKTTHERSSRRQVEKFARRERALEEQIASLTTALDDARRALRKIRGSRVWRARSQIFRILRGGRRTAKPRLRGDRRPTRAADNERAAAPTRPPGRSPSTAAGRADPTLVEDRAARTAYEAALRRRTFSDGPKRRLAMAVFTTDLDQGRGDVYTAIGLGRALEQRGCEVVYLPRASWYDPPPGTEVYLSLLETLDPARLPADVMKVAWVRNQTDAWVASPALPLYDAVLCSSERARAAVRAVYPGPTEVVPIGVDPDVFSIEDARDARHGVVSTVNQWGRERQLFRALRRLRLDVPLRLYGRARGMADELTPHHRGMASFFALPSLYRGSLLVLDDHNETTAPYGTLNSRIYEALACGSLVITNTALGLAEAGLDDLPTYRTPDELEALMSKFLAAPDETMALARRLATVVRERHTYAHRAEHLDAFLEEVAAGARGEERLIVAFSPDYRANNPYQRLIYSWGPEGDAVAVPVAGIEPLLSGSLQRRAGRVVYHQHWTAPILGPAETEEQAIAAADRYLAALDEFKRNGGTVIWTVHNVLPHECAFVTAESQLRQGLADRAEAIHVMCALTPELVEPYYRLPPERTTVIPHPSYVDVYPNAIERERARHELDLPEDATVLLTFGGVRAYKGMEGLLDAFDEVARMQPDHRLMVVGPSHRFAGIERITERCEGHPAILANLNRIADEDVQVYMNAADVVVLPHMSPLNSGALLLALSFGRPVIAPAMGCLAELLDERFALTFDPQAPASLRDAMLRARDLAGVDAERAAFETAAALRYPAIADRFAMLMRGAVEH